MAITSPQPPPQKSSKAGLGCLGCGCIIVLVVVLGFGALIGGGIYMGFRQLYTVSSATAESIPPYTGGDDVFASAQKKIAAFNSDVSASKTSTLTLSADEINALIYHNADIKKAGAGLLVSMTGDQMRVQASIPSNVVPFVNLGVKDRFFNLDVTSGISFNPDTKEVELDFRKLQLGDINLPANSLVSLQTNMSQMLNQKLRQNAGVWNVLQNAKSVSIKDGQFVVETK